MLPFSRDRALIKCADSEMEATSTTFSIINNAQFRVEWQVEIIPHAPEIVGIDLARSTIQNPRSGWPSIDEDAHRNIAA